MNGDLLALSCIRFGSIDSRLWRTFTTLLLSGHSLHDILITAGTVEHLLEVCSWSLRTFVRSGCYSLLLVARYIFCNVDIDSH